MRMKIDWTDCKKIDFMEKFSAEVKKQKSLKSTLEHYEDCLSCDDCAFFDVCGLEHNAFCYDTLKTVYEEYCEKIATKTTAEKTKEKMLVFIEFDGAIEETLKVTTDQYKVIKHFAERGYFDASVEIYTEETLEKRLTDFT